MQLNPSNGRRERKSGIRTKNRQRGGSGSGFCRSGVTSPARRDRMLKNVKLQFMLVAGVSALIGYASAYGHLNPFAKADARPADQPKEAASAAPVAPGCCSDGLSKAGMLALASRNEAVADKAAASGKKPNIVFIMGDDVGWFNIGAYHRGIMSGKTPNLDKLAAEGMLFTDYY